MDAPPEAENAMSIRYGQSVSAAGGVSIKNPSVTRQRTISGTRGGDCLRKLLGLPTLESGVGIATLLSKRVRKCGVGLGIVGVGCDRGLELGDGLGELTALEEESSAVESKVCTLAVDRDAAEIRCFFSLGGCAGSIALLAEDGCERNVRAGLVRAEFDGTLQCFYCLLRFVVLLVDIP